MEFALNFAKSTGAYETPDYEATVRKEIATELGTVYPNLRIFRVSKPYRMENRICHDVCFETKDTERHTHYLGTLCLAINPMTAQAWVTVDNYDDAEAAQAELSMSVEQLMEDAVRADKWD